MGFQDWTSAFNNEEDKVGFEMLKVGIVIPCCNDQQYLRESVQSVIDQTYKPASVIIIDDGSEEPVKREDLPDGWEDYPIWLVRNPTPLGPAAARNLGITLVGTPWYFPLDADDTMYPYCLERCADAVARRPNIDVVQVGLTRFGKYHAANVLMYPMAMTPAALQNYCVSQPTALTKKSVWEAVGGLVDHGWGPSRGGEDWEFWCKVFYHPHQFVVHQIHEPLVRFRDKPGGISSRINNNWIRAELTVKYSSTWKAGSAAAKCLKYLRTQYGVEKLKP